MGTDALRGALPALVTPLTADGEVDGEGTRTLVGRAVDDGATGVLVAGSTGEGTLLRPDQRVTLTTHARACLSTQDEAAVLVAGASGPTVSDVDDDIARLAGAGADLVLVLAPNTYPLRPEELVAFHLDVAERSPVPTLVYHIPQFTGSSLTPELLPELAAHPQIVGMKDSSPDADRRRAFARAVHGDDGFSLVSGHAPSLQDALEAGVAGSITAIANVRQRQVVGLHAAVANRADDEAAQAQDAITRTGEALAEVGASMMAVLKAALQLEGVIAERWCRPPLGSVGPQRLDHVRTALLR